MAIFDKARELKLRGTGDRLDKVANRQATQRRINNLVTVTGHNSKTGKFIGTFPDGSSVEFNLATNNVPAIGQDIEVAIARGSSFGRGDLKPVKLL